MADEDQWRRQRRRKVVKDLEWVLSSPHILSSRFQVLPTDISQTILAQESTQAWLDALHDDPTPLYTYLAEKRRERASLALGVYFASLLEFWLRHCPSWQVNHLVVGQQLVTVKASRTVGQLKFVFRMSLPSSSDSVDMHWEASIKFFLLTAIADPATDDSTIKLEHFVGPHLGENLAWRATEVTRKLEMCRLDVVRAWLASHFPAASDAEAHETAPVQSHMLLRGYLFYPLAHLDSTTGARSITQISSDIEPDHLRGWWTVDFAADLLRASPAHARWAILPKMHWLSPVVAHWSSGDVWVIAGDAELALDSIDVLDRDALFRVCTEHFQHSPTAMPLLVAELHVLETVAHEDSAATNTATRPLVEVSRGFVMNANTWKPQPLTHDARRFRRNKPPNPPHVDKTSLFNGALFESMPWSHDQVEREYEPPRPSLDAVAMQVAVRLHESGDDASSAKKSSENDVSLKALLARMRPSVEGDADDEDLTAMELVHRVYTLLQSKRGEAAPGQFIPSHGAIKAATSRALQARDVDFLGECVAAVVAFGSTVQAFESGAKDVLRVGHVLLDAAPASASDGDAALSTTLASVVRHALADPNEWWSVRFLVKAKQVLMGATRAGAADDLVLESTVGPEDDGCIDVHFVEGVMEVMLEPGHGGKWNATVVDLCGAYALPRSDARAATILSTLLDANDPVAAEAFVLSQQKHRSSQLQELTQTFVSHPNTPAKAAKRLASLSSQGPHSHTSQATGSQPIVDADHQLSLVQSVLATRLTVHLVESPHDVSAMMAWIDETLVDPNHPPASSSTSETKVVVVGLDCEWRPRAFSTKHLTDEDDRELVQVVQLAFPHGHVFVLDCAAPSVLEALVAVFHELSRPWVVVTGFCVTGDLDRLVSSCPALTSVVHSPDFTCVELRRVALARANAADVHAVQRTGLAGLAASYLHLTIPKDQQTSDWAVRPLTADQIEYAALDAHCVRLLLLYFTAGLDGMHPIQDPWTTCTAMWESWRVHPQAYLGEKDVAAAVASLGLTGSFHTLPRGGVDGHVVIKTVAWTLHPSRQDDGGSTAQIQHLAVVLDLAKTIEMDKLLSFVRSTFPDHESSTATLASERDLLRVFGYSRGCIGPVGLRRQSLVHVVIDASLMHAEAIYCGAGALHRVVALSPSQLLQSRHLNISTYDVAV